MDNQAEVREFLRTRRARLTPQRAGIIGGGRRRVTGLRREEVATLAGVSTDYYARMERTVASLITSGSVEQLPNHLRLARQNGLTEIELKEAIVHLAFYAGWPKAMSAIQVAKHIFAE